MDKRKNLQSIANAIYAADKIRNILKDPNTRNSYTPGKRAYNNISVFGEVIRVIADYLPNSNNYRGNSLKEMVDKSAIYINTYKKLKQQLISARNGKLNKNKLVETLAIVRPLLKNERKVIVDKVLKIYEILNT
ncbi:MAG: hypothetical protein HPY74_02330 [Firmicutes bacterium]|nr:hypothetical protein [Bacillota bacterium]